MSKSSEHTSVDLQNTLSSLSTIDLVYELSKREGVAKYDIPINMMYTIQMRNPGELRGCNLESYTGPVTIVTITEP